MTQIKTTTPIFRMFDEAKAREFYLDYLGFTVTFEHRFDADAPLYLGLSFGGALLHLSEHYGDATPGGAVRLEVEDIEAFHAALPDYKYQRPGIEDQPWGCLEVIIRDPFHNRLVFFQDRMIAHGKG